MLSQKATAVHLCLGLAALPGENVTAPLCSAYLYPCSYGLLQALLTRPDLGALEEHVIPQHLHPHSS